MRTKLINSTILHLLNFEKYSSFQQALEGAAIASDYQVVLFSKELNPLIQVETRHVMSADEAILIGKKLAFGNESYRLVDINGLKTYWGVIKLEGERYQLLIVDNNDNYTPEEISMLAEIIELAMGMWKYTPSRDTKADLIRSMLRGNRSLAFSIAEEMGIKESTFRCVFNAKGINTPDGDDIISRYISCGTINIIRITEDDNCYGVVLSDNEESGNTVCRQLFDELKKGDDVRIFHVTSINGVSGAVDGFRLIEETSKFVEAIFPFKRVFTKYELVMASNCINIRVQNSSLKKNYMDLLEPFMRGGDHKGRQLLNTLQTFVLDAGMNSIKTSEFLGIHANTVQYRLKKINEVLGAEITGNRVIPGLTIALALTRLEDVE